MRKKDDTLRDTLLNHARTIADMEGIHGVNIRSIAQKSGVATGTVYNYFSSKDEILLALTEEYWQKALLEMQRYIVADSFCEELEKMYDYLGKGIDHSAGMLMRSLGKVEMAGQERMTSMQGTLEGAMIQRMDRDEKVRQDIWNESFTKEQYARFIMMNMMMMLRAKSPHIHFLITIIKRTIY